MDFDVIIIGAGPGGYVAAIRASQLGLKTAVIEKESPGGVCLNIGCIPSKSLIHQAHVFSEISSLEKMGVKIDSSGLDYAKVFKKSRQVVQKMTKGVEFLLKKNNVTYISGTARFKGPKEVLVESTGNKGTEEKSYTAKNILIATGSRPREIPGFEFDEKQVLSSTGALMQDSLPNSMIILGAGAIGMEFAYIMNSFGVDVTVVEMMDSILPLEDIELSNVVKAAFLKKGIKLLTSTKAQALKKSAKSITLTIEDKDGKTEDLTADKLLVAIGRVPNTENLGLDDIGISTDRGFIPAGDYYQTAVQGVYAIGDVVKSPLLAHVASKEGEIAVEHIAGHGKESSINPMLIPSAVYCHPEVGSFGYTEKAAREAGLDFGEAVFPFRGIGKAVAMDGADGLVKIVYDNKTKAVLGAHIVGLGATDLIHELLLAAKSELVLEDIATMIHAHPTLSESVMEAARAGEGWAIHM